MLVKALNIKRSRQEISQPAVLMLKNNHPLKGSLRKQLTSRESATRVWNFCTGYSDVVLLGPPKTLAVFSGYLKGYCECPIGKCGIVAGLH